MQKTYVITGATSGIGLELVKALSKENLIYAGYRNEEKLKVFDYIENQNIRPFYIDMNDSNSIKSAAEYVSSQVKKVDTLINAAGCVVAGAVEELDINNIKYQFQINTFSHLEFTKYLLNNVCIEKIINISSMASFGVFPFVAPYCASKRALDILFNSLQIEYGSKIKIISIKPGVIATPLWDKSIQNNKELLSHTEKYKKQYEYLMKNAEKNGKNGINVKEVVKTVLQADKSKHPKASYKIGNDAFLASFLSIMPQGIINKILEIGLRIKIK